MRKIFSTIIFLLLFLFIFFIITLSTIGINTNKFNNLISQKITQSNNNIQLDFNSIKFKLDIKKISLFIETIKPTIKYANSVIPVNEIKVYIDFITLLKSEPKIKNIYISSEILDIILIKKLFKNFKPSNLASFVNHKLTEGKLKTEIEIYFNDENLLENFIAKGSVINLKAKILRDFDLEKANFKFFADKTDILLKNFNGNIGPFNIFDGDLKVDFFKGVNLKSNFTSSLKYNKKNSNFFDTFNNYDYLNNLFDINANLNNTLEVSFDSNYKVKKYFFKTNGKISKASFKLKEPQETFLSNKKIDEVSFIDTKIESNFNSKNNTSQIFGKYSLNGKNFLPFNLENSFKKEILKLTIAAEYDQDLKFEIINYEKDPSTISEISIDLYKDKENINIQNLDYSEGKNSISFKDLKFNKKNFLSLNEILVKTNKDGRENNNFSIKLKNKFIVNGNIFDARNLPKILNRSSENSIFKNINKEVEINLRNIVAPLSNKMKNFTLIGKIENGKFTKISSKGDYGNNNFLDISLKNDKLGKKKYLEIYSDLTRPLLTEFSFFNGLTGGNLLYSSIIEKNNSNSKLVIENFKVVNAPGMVKLLSLADLGGLADLAEGEGISFDVLEIKMEKNKDTLKINEILALGPSISVLMEGYQDKKVTSLRGTLIPAKTLNNMISKIPVIGDIIIPKEIGEGLFGISFKMKGPKGKIKTTINPIRTITPRFIQKIIDRKKYN